MVIHVIPQHKGKINSLPNSQTTNKSFKITKENPSAGQNDVDLDS